MNTKRIEKTTKELQDNLRSLQVFEKNKKNISQTNKLAVSINDVDIAKAENRIVDNIIELNKIIRGAE